jgi:hypothetical protein
VHVTFYFEPTGVLAERVQPRYGPRRQEYVHRCTQAVFEEVCHLVDEAETFTLEELTGVPSSQAALALRFLHRYGLVEKIHSRRCRRTEDSIHLSAMTCWHAEREGATRWVGEAAWEAS